MFETSESESSKIVQFTFSQHHLLIENSIEMIMGDKYFDKFQIYKNGRRVSQIRRPSLVKKASLLSNMRYNYF